MTKLTTLYWFYHIILTGERFPCVKVPILCWILVKAQAYPGEVRNCQCKANICAGKIRVLADMLVKFLSAASTLMCILVGNWIIHVAPPDTP
jgi:hypothetical protein